MISARKKKSIVTMPFYEIRLSVTGACNQNCVYCGPFTDGKYDKGYENLSLLQVDELINELKKVISNLKLHIQLTGGEPTLRKDLPEIVNIIKNKGIKDIGITTNGSMLNQELSLILIENGLSDFHIHLPSLDLGAYMKTVRKEFDEKRINNILNSAKLIQAKGARVEFNTPVTVINLPTLSGLLDFCYDNCINLKLIEELNFNNTQVSVTEIKYFLMDWMKRKKINVVESVVKNRYGSIYHFNEKFFFRIAPVSEEFQSCLGGSNDTLLDGRYWIGGKGDNFLYTPSYFLDPIEGTAKDIKKDIIDIAKKYNNHFNKSKK